MQATLIPKGPLFKELNKKIDGAMGLHLTFAERCVLDEATYIGPHPSINAVAGHFQNFTPMYLTIEVKRPNQDKDPLIQLGAWASAEFEKRELEGYSLDMPTLAIEIDGDTWRLWVVEAITDREGAYQSCHFIGPVRMGGTDEVMDVFRILHFLCLCADWGLEEYRKWVDKQILGRYTKENERKKLLNRSVT